MYPNKFDGTEGPSMFDLPKNYIERLIAMDEKSRGFATPEVSPKKVDDTAMRSFKQNLLRRN